MNTTADAAVAAKEIHPTLNRISASTSSSAAASIVEKSETNTSSGPVRQLTRILSNTIAPSDPIGDGHAKDTEFKPTARLYLAFLALCVLTLMVALDGTSLSVALPIIANKLHGSALEAFWAGTGFLLTSTVFQPNFASFSHIFGRVPLVMTAITLFFIGTMVAGFADGFGPLLVGRCIQGVGGGGVIAMTEVVITDLVPMRYRGQWAGAIGAMWAIGSVSGPIVGGAFSQKASWRWIFWLNLPFIGIGWVFVPLFLRLNVISGDLATKLRRVDYTGSVLFVASATSLLIPLTWGGVMYSWSSWHTLVPLILGIVGLTGFCFYEVYFAKEPVIRLSVFANRTVNIAYFNTVIHGLILWCLLFYQPLYFQAVRSMSPIMSGVALFPASFTVAPMSIVTGISITVTGKYRWTIWLGWAITILGTGLLVLLDIDTAAVRWIFIDLVSGIGLGILFPALQFNVQAASSNKDMAFAVAMFSFFRAFGQTLGVAIGGVIFQNQMVKNLAAYPEYAGQAAELAKDAAALVRIIVDTPQGPGKLALRTAYTDSIRTIYIVLCAIAAVAFVLSWFVKEYALSSQLDTEQGLVQGKKDDSTAVEEGKKEGQ